MTWKGMSFRTQVRNLEFGNDQELIASVLVSRFVNGLPKLRSSGRVVSLFFYPTRFDSVGIGYLEREYPSPSLHRFWDEIKPFYRHFEAHQELLNYAIDKRGKYRIHEENGI